MNLRWHVGAIAKAPEKVRVAQAPLLKLLAMAAISVVASTPALAQTIEWDAKAANFSHSTGSYECTTDVCSLPSSATADIPFPDLTITSTLNVTDGVLRGRMRVDATVRHDHPGTAPFSVLLRGQTSFSTQATVRIINSSFDVLVGGVTVRLDASIHNVHSSGVRGCTSAECQPQQTTQKVQVSLLRGSGEVADAHESVNTVSAGSLASSITDDQDVSTQEFTEPVSVLMPFEEEFWLSWEFESVMQLEMNNAYGQYFAENDFTGTLGFTSLRFFDADGNDVTSMVSVTFDRPVAFLDTAVTTPVPEPETYAMLLAGLGLLGLHARRRKQKLAA